MAVYSFLSVKEWKHIFSYTFQGKREFGEHG